MVGCLYLSLLIVHISWGSSEDVTNSDYLLENKSFTDLGAQSGTLQMEDKSLPSQSPPVHRLDFLTLIIPFLFLFCLSVIIFMLNLFKASFTTLSSLSRPSYRQTPDINIIEPSRSHAPGWQVELESEE